MTTASHFLRLFLFTLNLQTLAHFYDTISKDMTYLGNSERAQMSKPVERFIYNFSDIVLIGHRASGRGEITWYVECPQCHGQHMFRKQGNKLWHTSCDLSGIEWIITPSEYHVTKRCDLSRLLGAGG